MDLLINDLLEYARLTHVDVPLVTLDLNVEMNKACQRLGHEIASKSATISIKPLPHVVANELMLQQILTNLLGNALKFVAPGTIPKIEVWASQKEENRTRVFIKDNGIGIDPAHHESIFGLFNRLHNNSDYPGTGLGLAIVKKGIERIGGNVGVDPSASEGSCFYIDLSLAATPP